VDTSILYPILGGLLIGIGVSLFLFLNGRVFGVSGILGGALKIIPGDTAWRVAVLLGLVCAGLVLTRFMPFSMAIVTEAPIWQYIIAGLLVGFGTQLGSGCTSGHGICGISRFSVRSIVATIVFMTLGIVTVASLRFFAGTL